MTPAGRLKIFGLIVPASLPLYTYFMLHRYLLKAIMPVSARSRSPELGRVIKRQKIGTEVDLVEDEMCKPVEYTKTYEHELDYRNKLVLAPMVRTGSCRLSRRVWLYS